MEILDILVVDDEPGIRSGISRILKNFSVSFPFMDDDFQFNILEAATGEEALEIINTTPPSIVLLDNKLPGIQGIEVLDYINSHHLDIVVVMITSYASLDLAVKATNFGAYDFVPKPFTPQELKTSMENVAKHYFLRRMTRKLHKEGKHVRFQFLTVLSHELKQPLSTIENSLHKMKEKQEGESIDDYQKTIDISLAQVKAMRSLITDFLDLTRIESGKKRRELVEIDMGLVALSAIETMKPMSIQFNVNLSIENNLTESFVADPEEMEVVFSNLISNAIKYNKSGGTVCCKLWNTQNELVIAISDNGGGIEQIDIPNLFKEFSKIHNSNANSNSGSGLGLSIVKRIVELYKGSIVVKSEINVGSTFTVTFPLKNSSFDISGI